MGHLHSAYQPTEPAAFHQMMDALGTDFSQFTFIDIGSGKGRVLLMAADYPFSRVIGVELLPALHRIAEQNIDKYCETRRRCLQVESSARTRSILSFQTNRLFFTCSTRWAK